MLKLFKSNSSKTKENEIASMKFEKTEKTVNLQTYNTRAIQLIEQQDLLYLQADKSITNIQTSLQIDRKTGKISEIQEIDLKNTKVKADYSGFLGIINITGVNFLMFVKDVHILSVLDGRDKIYEMVSLDFVQINQSANKLSKETVDFTSYIEKYLCSKNGGYYFSYTYPLTVSQQKIDDLRKLQQNLNKPIFHLVENDFLWNHHLLKPLVDQMISKEWQAQLIQGHVYNVVIGSDAKNLIFYTIISRRQCKRGGTRYNHRGIDSDGYVANFVESEQIILFNSMKRIVSHLQIRGSVPSYWTQRGISAKLIIESSRELSDQSCSLHLNYLKANYSNVICVDLMTEKKQDELKLMTEFRYLLLNHPTESAQIGSIKKDYESFIHYLEFDFHREVKGDKFENIDKFISDYFLQELQNYGCFVKKYSLEFDQIGKSLNDQVGEIQWRQKGIVRTNCLDCLDRTNFFQLRVAFNAVEKVIFPYLGIELKNADFENFCKDFQYSWGKNGDRISNHYAGTKATTSMVAKKGKSGVLGFIKGKLTSGQRFFKGIFTDAYKQQCYSVILGEHYETQQNLEYQENLFKELKQAESRFINHNNITIFVASWSVNSYVPDKKQNLNIIFKNNLHNTNCNYKIKNMQQSSIYETDSRQNGTKDSIFSIKNSKKCDIVIVGLQEIVELSAKNILQISQPKSSDLQQKWQELIHEHIGGQQEYFFVDSHNMAGIITFVFARVDLKEKISDVEYDDVPYNLSGKFLNKGGVGLRFWVDDTSIAVLNCHLPAGQSNIDQKISSLNSIHQKLFQQEGMAIYKRDPIWKSDKVILMGNLNFRVDKKEKDCKNEIQQIINLQKGGEFVKSSQEIQQKLISYDQLKCLNYLAQNQNQSQKENVDQNLEFQPLSSDAKKYYNHYISDCKLYLENYYEKKIHFLPTYKFEVGSDDYHNSWKTRVPSYSDRIFIWDVEKQNQGIEQSYLQYDSVYGVNNSDHKPIFAILTFDVKEIDYQLREQIIEEIILKQQGKTKSNFIMNLNRDDDYDDDYQYQQTNQKGATESFVDKDFFSS
ncbi:hypothetical protein ABPG74_015002 [Tetrahymena malaccensis]